MNLTYKHTERAFGLFRDSERVATISTKIIGQEEVARRIVACVNALRGVPTEDLEQGRYGVIYGDGPADIVKQRDKLLAAAKHVLMLIDNAVDGFPESQLEGLRSAIRAIEDTK